MGIAKNDATALFYSKKLGVSFDETLMLGRLTLYATREEIASNITKYKTNEKEISAVHFSDEYAEPLFEILGAKKVDSLDFSAYEKASIIHDLNESIPESLKNRFTAVVDGGTIEHVFNFPVAIKNCMNALKVGGHYIGVTPANNSMGHGFYQFSPELYYRAFSEENGFKIKKMLISVVDGAKTHWYEVADPKQVRSRMMLVNNFPIFLTFIAEKLAEKNVFEITPQQSDYSYVWDIHKSLSENKVSRNQPKALFLYRKLMPKKIKIILKNIYTLLFVEKMKDAFIGEFNEEHYVKTEL